MASKKNLKATPSGNLPALKIGSQVRCTDDGVEGRIVWANAVAVKIKWDDGEQVTWKRGDLASKPIEFLDADEQPEPPPPEQVAEPAVLTQGELAVAVTETPPVRASQPELEVTRLVSDDQPPPVDATPTGPEQPQAGTPSTATASTNAVVAEVAPPKPKRQRKAPAEPKEKKTSALDAAAKVLAETGTPMTCKELIGTMAVNGYWSSPGGQTPDATLYSAMLREIAVKGEQSRFVKTGPGRFALRPTV